MSIDSSTDTRYNSAMRFASQGVADLFYGVDSKAARKTIPANLRELAAKKLTLVIAAQDPVDLRVPPSNHFEALSGKRKGQFSIRINLQYRICFSWSTDGADEIEIVDYH